MKCGEVMPIGDTESTERTKRDFVHFHQLPMPPSSNTQYKLFRRGQKTYHVPSDQLIAYRTAMDHYRLMERYVCDANIARIAGWLNEGMAIEIRAMFFFHRSKIFTQKGGIKKMDVTNRIKAIHDNLCRIIGIDDSLFFREYSEKAIANDSLEENVYVEMLPVILL